MPSEHLGKCPSFVVFAFFSFAAVAFAQTGAPPAASPTPPSPIVAKLTFPLDVKDIKVGTRVKARVIQAWSQATCDLKAGALLEGHVAQAQKSSKTDPRSAVEVIFDTAECSKHNSVPFNTTVIAMQGPNPTTPVGQDGLSKGPPLTDIPLPIGLRSVETASADQRYFVDGATARPLIGQWKAGQVVDVPFTNLAPGMGAGGGSIIWSPDHNVRLELATTLIFIPKP